MRGLHTDCILRRDDVAATFCAPPVPSCESGPQPGPVLASLPPPPAAPKQNLAVSRHPPIAAGAERAVDSSSITSWANFAGTAIYRTPLEVPPNTELECLDLDVIHELSEVTLNGRPIGVRGNGAYRHHPSQPLVPSRHELGVRVTTVIGNGLNWLADSSIARARPPKFRPAPQACSAPLISALRHQPVRDAIKALAETSRGGVCPAPLGPCGNLTDPPRIRTPLKFEMRRRGGLREAPSALATTRGWRRGWRSLHAPRSAPASRS